MRWSLLIVSTLAMIPGCDRRSSDLDRGSGLPLPKVSVEEVPAPKEATIIAKGSNLQAVGAEAYGHERFSGFVAAMNGITDPERVQAGSLLKTPSLAIAFRDAGADAIFQPALNVLSKACTDYYAVEPAYLAARRASGVASGEFAIPSEISAKLHACADAVEAGVGALSNVNPPYARPSMTIDQFKQAAGHIRELAAGLIDGLGYDYDLVGQRFGLAFTNALIWTHEHHR